MKSGRTKVRLQFYQPVHHACHQNPGASLCLLPSFLALIKVATIQSSNSINFFFLPVFTFHVNGIIEDVLFCAWLLSFSIVGGSSVLSHVIVSHSFSLFHNVLQCEYGLPGGSDSKESACDAEDPGLIPGSQRSSGEGNRYLVHYSCLENPMDRGAWGAAVHGITKSWTQLSD